MTLPKIVHNKDCAMWLGMRGRHCSGWSYSTCEGCKMAKLKSEGYYRRENPADSDYLHIKRRKDAC